jgi:hypothetical protein
MRITYTPEDNPTGARSWDWNPRRIRQSEASLIERHYGGKPYEQFVAEAQGMVQGALRVLLWRLMCRDHPMMAWKDAPDPYVDEVEVEHSAAELRDAMASLERAPISQDERELAMSVVKAQLADAEAREAREAEAGIEVESGK